MRLRLLLLLCALSTGLALLEATPTFAGLHTDFRRGVPHTVAWAREHANADVAVSLHDYYGLTLRFVSARTGATCAGVGAAASTPGVRRWWRFRCTTHLRGDEGTEFPAVVAVTLTLGVPAANGSPPLVSAVHVTGCTGKACPIH